MNGLYYILLIGSIAFPLAWSFENKVAFYKKWKSLFPAMAITACFFLVWDQVFTQQGHWGFNPLYIKGPKVGALPVEEILFFFVVPYACVFIYACVGHFLPGAATNRFTQQGSAALAILLLIVSFFYADRAYTFYNFLLSGMFLLVTALRKPHWLMRFWIAYGYHLVPFFIVNGILTGLFTAEPVVLYDDEENLGIKILWTIPIEDTIYSMLLLLMNISLYEFFNKRFAK